MLDKYIEYVTFEKRYSKHTIKAYVSDLKTFLSFISFEFDIDLSQIDRKHIKAWIVHLSNEKVCNRSINRNISSLRGFFNFLILHGVLRNNPCRHIKALRQSKRLPVVYREEELFDFKKVCLKEGESFLSFRDYLIMELLYQTGIRRSELIKISIQNVEIVNCRIKIYGKGNKERYIPISKDLLNIISKYLVYRLELTTDEDFLFLTGKGKELYPKAVYNIVKKYLSLLSTNEFKSPHILRHSFATHMLERGADLNAVKDILGHANLSATQIYTHNTINTLRETYKKTHPKGDG